MSDFKIRFRDQQTGRQLEVEANQVKSSWRKDTVEESFDKSSVGDGQVDVMVIDILPHQTTRVAMEGDSLEWRSMP